MESEGCIRKSMTAEPPDLSGFPSDRTSVQFAAALAVLVVTWAALNLISGGDEFAMPVSDEVMGGGSVFGFELAVA